MSASLRETHDTTLLIRRAVASLKGADPDQLTRLTKAHPEIVADCVKACTELLEVLRKVAPEQTVSPE